METNNMNIREKFEEIWPVPEGVYWMPMSRDGGEYMADPTIKGDNNRIEAQISAEEWDARLDTFTRCQESMGPVLSLIEEMIDDLERDLIRYPWHDRAKQITRREK